MTDKTLQQRLRDREGDNDDDLIDAAADALDAKDERIKELEWALREWLEAEDAVTDTINRKEYSMPKGTRLVAAYARAREALK